MTARVLPLALVLGLVGAGQAVTADALGPALLVSITVTPAVASIAQGTTQQFTATGTYSDLSIKNLTNAVTWSSSASGTATVSNAAGSQGLATGIATGLTTIKVTDPSTPLPGTAALTVTPALPTIPTTLPTIPTTLPSIPATLVAVTVSPPVANVAVGAGEQFTAIGTYSDLSTRDLTDSVTWASSLSSTASVSNQGFATGIADGVTTITATDPTALVSGTAALTVTPVPALPASLVAVTVSPPVADVAVGAGELLTATGTFSDLSTQDLTDSVTWSSSSPSTASVSNAPGSQGLVTGIGTGVATVTATDPEVVVPGTAAVTVTAVATPVTPAPSIPQLALSPASGKKKAPVVANGSGFTPGMAVTITYLSGLKAHQRASTVLCHTTAASNGTFSCRGTIPRGRRSGKRGVHTVEATGSGGGSSTSKFTLVRR
ncbi:MAG TPA: Ig-like domain-containing protein [Acidimicrobiales bacterium]